MTHITYFFEDLPSYSQESIAKPKPKRGGARKGAGRQNMNSVNVQIKIPAVLAVEFKKRIREIKGEMIKTLKLSSSVFCIPSSKK